VGTPVRAHALGHAAVLLADRGLLSDVVIPLLEPRRPGSVGRLRDGTRHQARRCSGPRPRCHCRRSRGGGSPRRRSCLRQRAAARRGTGRCAMGIARGGAEQLILTPTPYVPGRRRVRPQRRRSRKQRNRPDRNPSRAHPSSWLGSRAQNPRWAGGSTMRTKRASSPVIRCRYVCRGQRSEAGYDECQPGTLIMASTVA
jgi:hypothetical protein